MVEIGELERIAQEEYRRVVAYHVPVAFLGVELEREAPNIPLGISRAAFAGYRGETGKQLGLLADLRENPGAGVFGDVVGDGEGAVGAGTLGVHAAFGDYFTVEMGELLQKPHILQQLRSARAGSHYILVVDNGCPASGGKFFLAHDYSP